MLEYYKYTCWNNKLKCLTVHRDQLRAQRPEMSMGELYVYYFISIYMNMTAVDNKRIVRKDYDDDTL